MQLLFSVAALSALSRATAFVPSVSVGVSSSRSRLSMVAIEPSSALTTPASRDVLADAFGNLSESDQYDAVLTGLCSKLLEDCADGSATTVDASSMSGPLDLLEEMHARDIPVSGRSLSALVDTAAASKSARVLETSLRSLRRVLRPADDAPPAPSPSFWNASPPSSPARRAALERYGGAAAAYLPLLPSDARARVRALEATDPLPADDRAGEMAAALTAAVAVAACVAADAVDQMAWGVELWQPDLALGCLAATAALDTGYGALQKSSRLVRAVPDLPENEMLGTGKITGKVWKGMRRLFNTDTERECQCEAAAFYAGKWTPNYLLPWELTSQLSC
uniref:Ubiquinone biosynthesis protein n=1 Tax=Corethron hystrix TaxID=216773 RepID=A0A7S1BMA1_9STRA|mmetsp:Transcript_32278/g.74330  ORF Transcript_32278/g.74330 Transcript_32278/m.74330 type:complete len:337 (+) Transcript_32278:114-1124(+)